MESDIKTLERSLELAREHLLNAHTKEQALERQAEVERLKAELARLRPCGMFGPLADEIARKQLVLDERYIITLAACRLEVFNEDEMYELVKDADELFDGEEALVAAKDACTGLDLPAGLWYFGLSAEGRSDRHGLVQFTPDQSEEVRRYLRERREVS